MLQVLKVLPASPAAYSANPLMKLSSPPSLTGSAISLVSIVQVVWCFSLLLTYVLLVFQMLSTELLCTITFMDLDFIFSL